VQWLWRRPGGGDGLHLIKFANSTGPGPKPKSCCCDTLSPCEGTAWVGDLSAGISPGVGDHRQHSQGTPGRRLSPSPATHPIWTTSRCCLQRCQQSGTGPMETSKAARGWSNGSSPGHFWGPDEVSRSQKTSHSLSTLFFPPSILLPIKRKEHPSCPFQKLSLSTYVCLHTHI